MKNLIFLAVLCVLSVTAFAKEDGKGKEAVQTFMPKNTLHLEDSLFASNMTESQFNSIIQKVENYYTDIVSGFNGRLRIVRKWRDSTVNAMAYRQNGYWYVEMYGGLARRPEITSDGFALVLCHELGHHLSGFPIYKNDTWAANEGQSDYFSSLACAKNIWQDEYDTNKKYSGLISSYAKSLCDTYQANSKYDQAVCYRSMAAGMSLAKFLARGMYVSIDTPDSSVVSYTKDAHPDAQCRLDTYVAGALCRVAWDDNVIPYTESQSELYTCARVDGWDNITARPRCWYAPKNEKTCI